MKLDFNNKEPPLNDCSPTNQSMLTTFTLTRRRWPNCELGNLASFLDEKLLEGITERETVKLEGGQG